MLWLWHLTETSWNTCCRYWVQVMLLVLLLAVLATVAHNAAVIALQCFSRTLLQKEHTTGLGKEEKDMFDHCFSGAWGNIDAVEQAGVLSMLWSAATQQLPCEGDIIWC